MILTEDPRWIAHQQAAEMVGAGLNAPLGAHEQYRRSLLPYVEMLAEQTPAHARKHMIFALFDAERIPLGVIAAGFRADESELELVNDQPVSQSEPVDEIERLARLPYRAYLRTEHWQRTRQDALKRAENRCSLCNSADQLQVHHRSYKRLGCERPADVAVLCESCHERHHGILRVA